VAYVLPKLLLNFAIGTVYCGTNILSQQEVAIKLEHIEAEIPQLERERDVYNNLNNGVGVPSVFWFGTEGNYNALVLERLGPSLHEIFYRCNSKFSLRTILLLADQLVRILFAGLFRTSLKYTMI